MTMMMMMITLVMIVIWTDIGVRCAFHYDYYSADTISYGTEVTTEPFLSYTSRQ